MSTAATSLTFPTTPPAKLRSNATPWYTRPSTSSPLAHNQSSSPVAEAQARRRSQFKSQQPSASSSRVASSSESISHRRSSGSSRYAIPAQLGLTNETPQVAFLRQRFKNKCIESAKKARQHDRNMRRWASDTSSDGADVDMDLSSEDVDDDENDDDAILNDEIFRRIVANERRKTEHAFRLSYEIDVGSSIDPDMMDVAEWEAELKSNNSIDDDEMPPEDLLDAVDDAELAALYEELEREQLQRQQQQEDDQRWEALLDDPLDGEFLCGETPLLPDHMES